ncbi:hypothetical protein SERLADRAFT_392587 [Serpula lacrymans var. lacrymans S7.9]|uniref:Uncharacterized protein n=1 Tax=Serpula lacrymans var. lacrymans (strain S7.9) TaxID=578457 RepID=F8NZB4_SERL9|nr:uncharacterized protein SERLADRAFT_392587 [Serpula lacrymans var. lacrymans S7.9]EGO23934.1 hypothetical protein SERLADRAFT_392587 [Serpula lacrymans var. lacrymans S7.9]
MASYNQDDSDVDSDAPRVAQWVDEDELDNWEDESDEDDEDEEIQEDGVSVAGPSMSRSQQRELEDGKLTLSCCRDPTMGIPSTTRLVL